MRAALTIAAAAMSSIGCHATGNPYESPSTDVAAHWKRVALPFATGTSFEISQGAFGASSHHQAGIEYRWDFDVPYGTPVLAVEAGTVLAVYEPHRGGGCDPAYSEVPNTLLIRHADGTVAQYTHVEARVAKGATVTLGERIAVTAMNGYICTPQLDFLIYRSDQTLYDSPKRESIPLRFEGLPGERAIEGMRAVVP